MTSQPTTYGYSLFVCVPSLSMNVLFCQGSLVRHWVSHIYRMDHFQYQQRSVLELVGSYDQPSFVLTGNRLAYSNTATDSFPGCYENLGMRFAHKLLCSQYTQ